MNVTGLIVNVNSADPARLTAFYRDVVQLPPEPGAGETAFRAGETLFVIDGHSDLTGDTKEPPRYLINFLVEDIAAEEARLTGQGVACIRSQGREFWGGIISTFIDPDGNYFQLVEFKPE